MNPLVWKYIAWTIGVAIIVVGLLFTLLYGHSFGYFKSILWLTAFVVSIATTLLIVEPIKQVLLSILETMCSKGTHFDIDLKHSKSYSKFKAYRLAFDNYNRMTVEDSRNDDNAETMRIEKYLLYYRNLTSDLFVFSMFLLTLLLIVLGSRDSMAFYSNRMTSSYTVKSKYVHGPLKPIISDADFLDYLRNVLIPTLHPSKKCVFFKSSYRLIVF